MIPLTLYQTLLLGLLLGGAYGIWCRLAPNRLHMLGALLGLTILVSFLWFALATWGAYGFAMCCGGVGRSPDYLVSSYLWWHTMILPFDVCNALELSDPARPAVCGALVIWPLPVALFALGLIGLGLARFGRWAIAAGLLVLTLSLGAYESSVTLADIVPAVRGVPIYPGAQDVWLDSENLPCTIAFTTPDPPDAILAYYRNTLPRNGWVMGESWPGLVTATRPGDLVNMVVAASHAGDRSKASLWLRAP